MKSAAGGLPPGIDPRAVAANPAGFEQWKQGAAQQAAMGVPMGAPQPGGMQSFQPMGGPQSMGAMPARPMPPAGPMPPGGGPMGGSASMGPRPGLPVMPGAPASGMLPQPAGNTGRVMPGAPIPRAGGMAMKKGGKVPEKYAKGGSVGGRGDGIAQRGKTRGKMV